jgi:hypothetical protein
LLEFTIFKYTAESTQARNLTDMLHVNNHSAIKAVYKTMREYIVEKNRSVVLNAQNHLGRDVICGLT